MTDWFFDGDPHLASDPAELVHPDLVHPLTRRDGALHFEHEFILGP